MLARAEALREETGQVDAGWIAEFKRIVLSRVRADLEEIVATEAMERGRAMSNDEAAQVALAPLDEEGG